MTDQTRVSFPLEVRVADLGDDHAIEGIVVPWNETSYLTPDPKGERFMPGSLTRSVTERGRKLKLFRNHAHDPAYGVDPEWDPAHETGLWARFRVPKGSPRDELIQEVRSGLLDAFSIGFQSIRHRRGADGAREILEARLCEVSIAPIGAYDGATVTAVRTPNLIQVPAMPVVNLDPIPPLRPLGGL